uniref:Defective in cullin neddylation protein n=1 Tax=Attheya septentrionalis TaxID=420275 RepID=A0A7S2UPU3_9STRA|mmetsp:Transcript_7462/g.13428  ORF Transcript_7462/g.13428 Transcript_7462/m.13428 type:complete len:249 (+) Transcript_7462:152-898(+)
MAGKRRKPTLTSEESGAKKSKPSETMWSSSSGTGRKRSQGNSRSVAKSSLNEASITSMFDSLAEEDNPYVVSMEGITNLCESLEIDPMEDIRILVLLWKMGANAQPGHINRDEWMKGCIQLKADSIAKLKKLMPGLDVGFLERSEFKDFFKFCFQFNRQGTHRTLDKELVIDLLRLVLKNQIPADRLSSYCTFLEGVTETASQKITLDQWTSFLDFSYEYESIDDYDEENSAWPILIDDYVDYMKSSN